jgi:PAS domain S-box-containing protein
VDPQRRAEFLQLLLTQGRLTAFVSEVWRHRTRERIWVSENAHVVRDAAGRVLCYEGTVEEITDRVRTQQALEQSEAQLRLIAEQLPGVVYLAQLSPDRTPAFRYISDGVRPLYGVEPAEAMADGLVLQRMRHPDDMERVQASLLASERAEQTHVAEFRIVRRDGELRWVQAASSPIRRTPEGNMRCGLIIDITERRQGQELRAERDRAEAARRAAAGLLSRISHELRTPLNAILGFAQLLERDASLGARQNQWAAESLRAGRHLLALVDDVLDLGRAESGEFALQIDIVDPAAALTASLALLTDAARQSGIGVTLPDGPLPPVCADAQRLRQILTNLLSNAIKYNEPRGWVRVVVDRRDDGQVPRVAIAVRDSGPGLDADQQARLFRPFERLGAERGPVPGTGLGLSLSQQLARAMGGAITVESAPGQGACFVLTLPAA